MAARVYGDDTSSWVAKRFEATHPKSSKQGETRCDSTASSSTVSLNSASKTVKEIRCIMKNLDFSKVELHFSNNEVEPYVVCDNTSVEVFNKYFGSDALPIQLRFCELSKDGHILIVDLPSIPHETTVEEFRFEFLCGFGNGRELAKYGTTTVSRGRNPKKEADASFGPASDTPGRTQWPIDGKGRLIKPWVTFILEVARSQSWASLTRAAHWWYNYVGVEYILLLKVSGDCRMLEYRFYDVRNNPLQHGRVPPPTEMGSVSYEESGAPVNVTFDNRRILSVPATESLPNGVNDYTVVDLRKVMSQAIRFLRMP